jgi:histidine triad (HIT) family protein
MNEKNCIFCRIIRGEIGSNIIYQDEKIISFMDLRQANPGHVLIVPKIHVETIYDLPVETGESLMQSMISISRAVRDAFGCEGMNIWQSNGEIAGQEVPHLHFHIQPRRQNDGLLKFYSVKPELPPDEILKEYARKIMSKLPG